MRIPPLVFSTFLLLLFLSLATSLNPDGLSLLALKSAISSDPSRILSAWKESDPNPCNWVGIICISNRVSSISLPNKGLSGYIPSEIGFLQSLQHLSLRNNNFSNPIPSRLFNASSLISLDLSHNSFTGPIPPEIQSLKTLTHLDLSSNLLNGSLLSSLSDLPNITGTLNLSYNRFSGPVPDSFGKFPVWVSLDLRYNNLSGPIPQIGSLLNQGPTAFAGNPSLCGFPLRSPCPDTESPLTSQMPQNPKPNSSFAISPPPQSGKGTGSGISVPILSGVFFIVGAVSVSVWFVKKRWGAGEGGKARKGKVEKEKEEAGEGQKGDFFVLDDEGFGLELEELLRASAYVVGKSHNGIVYKVVVGKGVSVAVRRLSEGFWRFKEFETEVEAIAKVGHPNIVRLRAYYYATDEKLLVSDFISNGSLHAALHGGPLNTSAPLSWAARLKIAQGAARGLAHIHECSPRKYVHGNIKSSKILLDDDLQAYISGFGLNRLVTATYNKSSSSDSLSKKQALVAASGSGLGSKIPTNPCASYVAPEARTSSGSKLTQKCDVYSFGIVLLEILTGRLPDFLLEGFVRKAFREERPLSEIVDPLLLHEVYAKKQVLAAFHVALGCTEMDPEMRPRMRSVSDSLDRIG